jgi:hypothetical protein
MTEVEIFKQSLDVSRIVMLITILMTIISATFSALTLAFQRSHNIKSVKPFCNIIILLNSNVIFIAIKNAGLGPMIIKNITINDLDNRALNIDDYFKDLINAKKTEIILNNEFQTIIAPNEEKVLINITKEQETIKSNNHNQIIEKLQNTTLMIEYKDIYDKNYLRTIKL